MIAQELRLDPIQVRKDLTITGIVGKPKRGYPVVALMAAIEHFLGWDEMQQAVLAFRQHADKWQCKAQSIGIEASDAKQNAESQQQQLIDQINGLENDLAERKQLKNKTELMLQQMDQQIKSLKQQISSLEKKSNCCCL